MSNRHSIRGGRSHRVKLQTPSSGEVPKISNTKPEEQMPGQTVRWSIFELDAWRVSGAWNLEFGTFCLGSQLLKNQGLPPFILFAENELKCRRDRTIAWTAVPALKNTN
jgi:hypothetical protein